MKKTLARIRAILKRSVDAGTRTSGLEDTKYASYRAVNLLCGCIIAFILVFGPIFYHITRNPATLLFGGAGTLLLLFVIVLQHWRRYYLAKVVFYLIMNVMTLLFSVYLDRPGEAQLMYFYLLSLIFLVFEETAIRLVCLFVIVVRFFLLELNFNDLILKTSGRHAVTNAAIRWVLISFILFLIVLTFYLYIARLIRSEKMSEKRFIFTQHMSHDVQIGYFSVAGICAHLKDAIDSNRTLMNEAKLVNALMDASNYYAYILNNFLEYNKSDVESSELVHYGEMDLGAEIEKIVELHKYIAREKGVDISVIVGDELPSIINSDRTKVIRIFLNLLSNALKNTPEGKSIVVKLNAERHQWNLSVINEGRGLQQEKVNTLFIPYNVKNSGGRERKVGFGLPIVKDLVDTLGGSIRVMSELNKKTAFMVSIPFAQFG